MILAKFQRPYRESFIMVRAAGMMEQHSQEACCKLFVMEMLICQQSQTLLNIIR